MRKARKCETWTWFGNAGHLIIGHQCRFHLATLAGTYLVSTVGEYWPDRAVREILAEIHDRAWISENRQRKGDDFDDAYMKRFGFEEIGCDRRYETMVFKAGPRCSRPECGCGLPQINGSELDFAGYNDAGSAARGHLRLCHKWGRRAKG